MADNTTTTKALSLEEVLQGLNRKQGNTSAEYDAPKPPSIGMKCDQMALYEGPSKCNCCINWVENYPEDIKESVEDTPEATSYAIICRAKKSHGTSKKPLELHSIVIQSPLLKSVLGDVFADYPGITTTLEEVTFTAPFWEFFYRWGALTESEKRQEFDTQEHIRLLLDTLNYQLRDVRRVAQDLSQNNVITYDYLWTLFPPGALVCSRLYDQDCFLEVETTRYCDRCGVKTYDLCCKYIEWNGEKFGWKSALIQLRDFSGTRSIHDLAVYPVPFHKSADDIRSKLLERGRKFVSLSGWHHKAYCGILRPCSGSFFRSGAVRIDERIVVDAETCAKHTRSSDDLDPIQGYDDGLRRVEDFPDRLLTLCSPTVLAYGLRTKEWGRVDVSDMSDIVWNKDAFSSLVLAEETKGLVASFVRTQMSHSRSPDFDDIIEGKGRGMVFCLTGEPGVGKTLTAETVAEEMRTPLYMVSAGELGISSSGVEHELTKVLDLAYRWNAVLLLDESDVFLEQRDSQNLQRNQLVSIFLRMLEYYRGTLFLTTNRLSVFDVAFQSRIHLTLHYPDLDHTSRRNIWALLLRRVRDVSVTNEELDAVSKEPMNGRQIKNAVKAAQLLAADEGTALNLNHINVVLRVMHNAQNQGRDNNQTELVSHAKRPNATYAHQTHLSSQDLPSLKRRRTSTE